MDENGANSAKPATARDRILAAATTTFYAEGIRAVPVDRIIEQAAVTRATFYRYFPGKEDLVHAYVQARDEAIRQAAAQAARAGADPAALLRALVDGIADDVCTPGFRGCPFINAAAEYPDPAHPVRRAVAAHRDWFRQTLADLLGALGQAQPAVGARTLTMLRDGAMVGGYLDGADSIHEHLRRCVAAVVPQAGLEGGRDGGRSDPGHHRRS